MDNKYYLAIDLGASSGRHIVGYKHNGEIVTDEVYRFANGVHKQGDTLIWDIEDIFNNVLKGIKCAFSKYPKIQSLSIDTWGVDYVLMQGDKEVFPCVAYRDDRTQQSAPLVHNIISFEKLYSKTGIQFQYFNTIYQLYSDLIKGRLDGVTDFLSIPEYLSYRLTGVKKKEYTFATTTGLVNAHQKQFDMDIVRALKLPENIFKPLCQPGEVYGELKADVRAFVGGNTKVVMCASHDTASAVEGIPVNVDAPYISSGTWSLLGIKSPVALTDDNSRLADYSNEGGVGYIRFQKNIMGLWIIQNLKKELCPNKDFGDIATDASKSDYDCIVDVNDNIFFAPDSMKLALDTYLTSKNLPLPVDDNGYFKCAYVSLAYGYKKAIKELQDSIGQTYDKIYIVGGGAKNAYLNSLTEQICGVKVCAFPIEATAFGNLKIQMESDL